MNKTLRIIIYSLITLAVILLVTTVGANIILKNKLENLINTGLPNNMATSYDELSVHTIDGAILLTHPSLVIKNKLDHAQHTFINADELRISGISIWSYIFKKEIHIGTIEIENASIVYYKDRMVSEKDSVQDDSKFKKPIYIDRLKLDTSKISVFEKVKDSTKLAVNDLSVEIDDIVINPKTLKNKIPLEYKKMRATSESIFVKANSYDNLTLEQFSFEDNRLHLINLHYYTKYSKAKLSQIIAVERDHYDLSLKSLSVRDFDFGYRDTLFFVHSKLVSIKDPSFTIFRDKLVADDNSIKPLYSKSLRELPFELTMDSVKIENAFLKYEEKVQVENSGGFIKFENLNAEISNFSNTYGKPEKTEISIKAIFMDKTPLTANWSFDDQNPNDQFLFKARVGALDAERMNRFTQPNLRVRLEGQVNETYFTIDGNNDNSTTDIKINYSDFKVSVLKNEGKDKNKFLSAIVNIFVSKNSQKKENNYREGTGKATRDKTKSVFNLLWVSVKSALQKSMI